MRAGLSGFIEAYESNDAGDMSDYDVVDLEFMLDDDFSNMREERKLVIPLDGGPPKGLKPLLDTVVGEKDACRSQVNPCILYTKWSQAQNVG